MTRMKSQSIANSIFKICSIVLFILPTMLHADPNIKNLIEKSKVEPVLQSQIEPYDSMVSKIPSIPHLNSLKTITDVSVSSVPRIKDIISNRRPTDIFAMLKNRPSHLNVPITQSNIRSAVLWNREVLNKVDSRQWMSQIDQFKYHYQKQFESDNRQRFTNYEQYWKNSHYHNQFSRWHKWGFHGGFWYPTRPFFAIENYFTYPTVQWLFVDDSVAPEYFKSYYSEKMLPPDCLKAFTYKNIYFPSDTLRDLLVEASAFPQNVRCNFRTAIINMTSQLKKTIDERFFILFSFKRNDIVINHYQNLQNKAIVVAGFINQGKIKVAFEALMDLRNPNRSISFIPESSQPTDKQLQQLYQLTNRIRVLGGNPFTASQEPSLNNYNPVNLEAIAPKEVFNP